ncbi:MAG: geranylgeranylglyceryl/heptaprenylglyceryl phosphate synthase [Candidatus Latescibacteria bacterium]|nr:geranylgeranylglyceryl/heptaprenylglyceryl phosphate synthase [Candidatus Latescibacterota bacterium]
MSVFEHLLAVQQAQGAGYLALLDPDKLDRAALVRRAVQCAENGVDALLIGSSLLFSSDLDKAVGQVKEAVDIPVILFPGDADHLSRHADAILFLSLLSGRNPYYLIGAQCRAAPLIKNLQIEPIPTGYLLIASGHTTSAEFMSDTSPIPRENNAIAMAHALAAEYLGMRMVYLEAGSGADMSVPAEMIRDVKGYTTIPLIVGGGIRDVESASEKVEAGADFIVIGTVLEEEDSVELIREFADAIHR